MSREFLPALNAIAKRHPSITLYVFGSSVHGSDAANDLDVLVVYVTSEEYDAFRTDLDQLEISPLIDLVAMTGSELVASGFLRRSRAVPLTELSFSLEGEDRGD